MSAAALIQGASRGIGLAMTGSLLERDPDLRVIATCREPSRATALQDMRNEFPARLRLLRLDLEDEASLAEAAQQLGSEELNLLVNCAGILHDEQMKPERALREIDPVQLHRSFAINAIGPLLVAKHFHAQLPKKGRSVFASLSARIGSIGDNRAGGWYGYRGSKAAQNMFTKTLAVELARVRPDAISVALHPGTVATDLSAPFRRGVSRKPVFSAETAARQLLDVIDGLEAKDHGGFFAWDGSPIPW
ncbi:MAG: SDR family oxidoreductase [Myxococcales bacterium FL481]|nr:MAG: SDR family oxidoreductase [Myxococcales bacterium FL481]